MKKLHNYSIMPLNMAHIDEICEDIKEQVTSGVCMMPLFSMTLVPEGTPVKDKASVMAAQYSEFKSRLDAMGIPSGILVQATIGHGRKLAEPSPFKKIVGLVKVQSETICPYDDDFCNHMRGVFSTLALASPDHIMVDDDFRLINRADGGCACPVHLGRFAELSGVTLDRDGLRAALEGANKEEYIKIFVETQRKSVLKAARAMREGIDAVDPKIPGSYCGCGRNIEFGEEIAEILAGEGNPVIVRINNGNYTTSGARNLSFPSYRAATQSNLARSRADIILAETDTCPQNRYSTGAHSLHSHFVASILEGCAGAKHWITRLVDYEPKSGIAYRKILAKYNGFYTRLADIYPDIKWVGARIPLSSRRSFIFEGGAWFSSDGSEGFAKHVLERLGLPLYFSSAQGGAAFLSGKCDKKFTNDELRQILSGPVFIAAESAEALISRGLGEYLGVDVRPYSGKNATNEIVNINGKKMAAQCEIREIIPLSDEVVSHSTVYHAVGGHDPEPLFPGVTSYKNSLGGTAVVFSGTPITEFHYGKAFSFLNESRKAQLVDLLSSVGCLPVYYVGDEEVYLRAGNLSDGSLFVCLFNIGLDPIEEITLAVTDKYTSCEMLTPSGEFEAVGMSSKDGKITVNTSALTLTPVVLKLRRG